MKKSVHNKEINRIEISTAIILAILILGFLSIVYQITLKNVVVDIFGIKSDWVVKTLKTDDNFDAPEIVDIDWEKEYPFPEEPEYEQVDITLTKDNDDNSSDKKEGKIGKVYSMLDKYSSKYFTLVDECKIMSKAFSKSLGMNLISDSNGNLVFYQPDGRMMAERPYKSVDAEISNVNNFAEWLQQNGIDYIYVNVPSPVDQENESYIIEEGYKEYSNLMADELLEGLDRAGTNYLDIRTLMKSQGMSYTDSFFQYDHHWLPQTGLWAAGQISEYIDECKNLVTDYSVFNKENYDVIKYKEDELRGWGRIVTHVYADEMEIDMYYPRFDTAFKKIMPKYNLELKGDFEEVMYTKWEKPSYGCYNHEIMALKRYVNASEKAANVKILLLTDSYSLVVSPFLACAYSDIDEIDLRFYDGSLETFVKKNNYDLVISIYSAHVLNAKEELFEFK